MSKYWRVIEYEAADDAAGAAWIERTLANSINGTYQMPNGCRITACGATLLRDPVVDRHPIHPIAFMFDDVHYSVLLAGLPRARERKWEPPVESREKRQQLRGDAAGAPTNSSTPLTATVMIAHVAAADDCRAPFDWSEHEESADCWCQPEVEEKQTTESDHDYRDRIAATFDGWGALLSELLESNGSALEEFGAYRGVVRECKTVVTYVHRRPIDRGLDGRPRVISRWDVGA